MTIIVRSVYQENEKLCPQIYLDKVFVWIMKMLISERIDISQGIEFDKTDKLKKCMLCHYWYFKNIGHKFEPHVCN